jgi:hypothetical protein
MTQTISFRVVKEPYGWAVRMGEGMMTPFRSKVLAVRHANGFADALRRCGEPVEVVVEERPAEVRSLARARPRFLPFS